MRGTIGHRVIALAAALTIGTAMLAVTPLATLAVSNYDDTNPAATPCGSNSYNVTNKYSSKILDSAGRILAQQDFRYSASCNTVWTRITNESGRGSGYAPATDLVAYERFMLANSCAYCDTMQSNSEEHDTLHRYGTFPYQGWSMQWSNQQPGTQFWVSDRSFVWDSSGTRRYVVNDPYILINTY
jgi:hypothetical protein